MGIFRDSEKIFRVKNPEIPGDRDRDMKISEKSRKNPEYLKILGIGIRKFRKNPKKIPKKSQENSERIPKRFRVENTKNPTILFEFRDFYPRNSGFFLVS